MCWSIYRVSIAPWLESWHGTPDLTRWYFFVTDNTGDTIQREKRELLKKNRSKTALSLKCFVTDNPK